MVEKTLNNQFMENKLKYELTRINEFCQRWKVRELAFFGSILRNDFTDNSDIDLLISFAPDATWSLIDFLTMKYQLEDIFGREVDLVEKEGLRNPYRRRSILKEKEIIYDADRS